MVPLTTAAHGCRCHFRTALKGKHMNTFRRITTTLVGIVATCVLTAGAAAAHPQPVSPNGAPKPVTSPVASPQPASHAQVLLRQKAQAEHMQRLFGQREAAAVAARRHAEVRRHSPAQVGSGSQSQSGSGPQSQGGSPSHGSGNGPDVAVLAITALAGLALGAAGSTASRRLRTRSGLAT
jgi:hypothetical protein